MIAHDFNSDGQSELLISTIGRNYTDVEVIYPKVLANYVVRIGEKANTISFAKTHFDRGFDLVSGDFKGVIRINSREGKEFYTKKVQEGIRLPSSVLCSAPGDMTSNRLMEIIVGCQNGEVIMVERIPGRKNRWDTIRGFSLGQIFQEEIRYVVTGDFNGNGHMGFVTGSKTGLFKEIEFRPQLQKFDLISEFRVETEPSCCFTGDVDKDGKAEVFIGEYSGRLSIFRQNRLLSRHELGSPITSGTVGDVDNDGNFEVIVGTNEGEFHILRQNTIQTHTGYSAINDIAICDLMGDRRPDLVFSIDKKRVIGFTLTRDKKYEKPNADLIPLPGSLPSQTKSSSQQAAIPSTKARTPTTPPPPSGKAYCPNCHGRVRYIPQYRRFYCYNCKKYVAPVKKKMEQEIQKPMLEAHSQGQPYQPYSGSYSFETPAEESEISQVSNSPLEKARTKVKSSLAEFGQSTEDLSWEQEEVSENETKVDEPNYFLPVDLESDPAFGQKFISDVLKIKHIILIQSSSGIPMFSQSFGKEIDVSLTSGFLSAVGSFTEEMSGEEAKRFGVFSEIGREGFWILIYEAKHSKIALLISEKLNLEVKNRIKIFMQEFEKVFADELENFSGFVSEFNDAMDLLEKQLRIEFLYPLQIDTKRMRLTAITPIEKKLTKKYIQFQRESEEDVFYLTELIKAVENDQELDIPKDELLKVLIKYLENGMLNPLPPPPDEI
jgi:hypothetical protein